MSQAINIEINRTSLYKLSRTSLVKCIFVQRANDIRVLARHTRGRYWTMHFSLQQKLASGLECRTMSGKKRGRMGGWRGRSGHIEKRKKNMLYVEVTITKLALKTGTATDG